MCEIEPQASAPGCVIATLKRYEIKGREGDYRDIFKKSMTRDDAERLGTDLDYAPPVELPEDVIDLSGWTEKLAL